jgi:hypothetical protein
MTETKATDPLSKARAAAQDLHATLSDAASRRAGAAKTDLEAVQAKTRTLIDSLKTSVSTKEEAARKHINEAMVNLESARKHAAEGAKSFGETFQGSVRKALAEARASAQNISEALAEQRASSSRKNQK